MKKKMVKFNDKTTNVHSSISERIKMSSVDADVDELEKPYRKPTLMLIGRQDSIVGYRGLWNIIEMYPRASLVILDRAGHALQIEQDILFTETVKEWLSRVVAEMDYQP